MAKDLTNSKIDRQNILNNSYAINEIEKACNIEGIFFEEKIAFTKEQVAQFYEIDIRTLERYLEICKEYNITAVIELKTSAGISNWTETNSPEKSRMPALITEIKACGMINNIIFLTSQYECLAWTRRNGYYRFWFN